MDRDPSATITSENGNTRLRKFSFMKKIEDGEIIGGRLLKFDQCKFGKPYQKRTLIWTNIRPEFLSPEKNPDKFLCSKAHPWCAYVQLTTIHQEMVECGGSEKGINYSQLSPALCDELMRAVFRQHNEDRILAIAEKVNRQKIL